MEVAEKDLERLENVKDKIRRAHDYFKPNYDRFNEFRRFVFESSLTNDEITLLATIGRPQLEFNVLEAYISRLLGEFSKQEPDIEVHAANPDSADPLTIHVVDMHLRHVLTDSKNHHTKYEVYKDLLSGGFSTLKVFTDYANPMSMDQVIKIERAYDPTLCGFDQLARYSHKGDGRFCFELFPMAKDDFLEENPDINVDKLNFRRDFAGFNWSYLNDATPTLIIADFYEKKKKEIEIVKIRGNKVMKLKDYKKMLSNWSSIEAPPSMIGKPRKTIVDVICRTRCIENKILEYVETDYSHLPLIFVDGNSIILKTPKNGNVRQFTKPYVYHAKGAQRLKNYAGISLANEIENTIQHKFMVAKEALPKEEELLQAYKDVQKASVMVFNSVHENNPEMPISNPIREIMRSGAPAEIAQTFSGTDASIQSILGNFDASIGVNAQTLSGIAIMEAATQNNSAAMPYVVGFLQGLQRAAEVYVDLMPKYFTTPATLPILDKDGERGYVKINQNEGLQLDFDTNALKVDVKAGASFQVQKAKTIMMVKEMMGMSPLFAQFIAEKGLNFVLDNMEGKGIEQLKEMVDGWVKELEQQKTQSKMMQQQQMQNDPRMIKANIENQKLKQNAVKDARQFEVDMAQFKLDEAKILADMKISNQQSQVQLIKAETERFAKSVDLNLKHHDMKHRHLKEAYETHHKINKPTHGNRGEANYV